MSTITESYKQAELALAAYANLTAGMSNTDFIKESLNNLPPRSQPAN